MLIAIQILWSDWVRDKLFWKYVNSLEKNNIKDICQKIDNYFFNHTGCIIEGDYLTVRGSTPTSLVFIQRERWNKKKVKGFKKDTYRWRSYFDTSLGIMIDSYDTIKKIEQERGLSYLRQQEYDDIIKKSKIRIKKERDANLKKDFLKDLADVEYHGRSFVREYHEAKDENR